MVVAETMRVLAKSGSNLVAEVLATVPAFIEWDHVPAEDVYDPDSGSQYYYHAHPKSEDGTGLHDDEHGHFHVFLRGTALEGLDIPGDKPGIVHLVGIGMNRDGLPIRLFTTNGWVTGETMIPAEALCPRLGLFEVDHVRPSWALNLWLTNMIVLFRPQIEQLLRKRDRVLRDWQQNYPEADVLEDRVLEVASSLTIDLEATMAAVTGMPFSRDAA